MFYEPAKRNHGLPRDPFKAIVIPRPIGWITSCSKDGRINLAPYSFFNALASDPAMVMFASNGFKADGDRKDSLDFVEETGEFVCNLATYELRHEVVETSAGLPKGVSEAEQAGLELVPSLLVKPPRVKRAPIHMECKLHQIISLPSQRDGQPNNLVIGEVIGIHIDDAVLTDGFIDYSKTQPIARLGYLDYAGLGEVFALKRPPGGAG